MAECPTTTKPFVSLVPTQLYGFPRGTAGRSSQEIQGILLHCIEDIGRFTTTCAPSGAFSRPRGIEKASVHYAINLQGNITQYVDDSDVAWGLGPILAQGSSNPTYAICNQSLDWDLTGDNVGIAADKYLIHIAIESPKNRVLNTNTQDGDDCKCKVGFDTTLSTKQSNNLIQLLAYLSETYDIALDVNHINFLHNIDSCNRAECGCSPCIVPLLCAVDDYCEPADFAANSTFRELEEGNEIVKIYGIDKYSRQRELTFDELWVLSNGQNTLRVPNRTNWETIIRNAAAGIHLQLDAATYTRTQVAPIELKDGQTLEGKGYKNTRILDPTGKSFLRHTKTINTSNDSGFRLCGFSLEQTITSEVGNAGFEDTAGGRFKLERLLIKGYDSNLVLNQSESAEIDSCLFTDARNNSVWIVNGIGRTLVGAVGFSNHIKFTGCTFSGGDALTEYLMRDEGGDAHSFRDCIFNGGNNQFFGSGLKGWLISGGYFEGAGVRLIRLDYQRADGSDGPGRMGGGVISGVSLNAGVRVSPVIKLISGDGLMVTGNTITGAGAGYLFDDNPDYANVISLGNSITMRTWNTLPQTRSMSLNASESAVEPLLVGLGYPSESATAEAIQLWFNNAKRRVTLNNGATT